MDKKKLHYIAVPANVVSGKKGWRDLLEIDSDDVQSVGIYSFNELDTSDYKDLLDLFKQCFNSADKFLRSIRHTEYVAAIRDYDWKIVGAAFLCGANCMSIEHVMIDEKFRRKGLATYLVRNIIDFTFRNLPEVPHLTLVSKPELHSLYEGCGFQCVAESGWIDE